MNTSKLKTLVLYLPYRIYSQRGMYIDVPYTVIILYSIYVIYIKTYAYNSVTFYGYIDIEIHRKIYENLKN